MVIICHDDFDPVPVAMSCSDSDSPYHFNLKHSYFIAIVRSWERKEKSVTVSTFWNVVGQRSQQR